MVIKEETLRNLGISDWSLQQCKYACDNLPCYLRDKPKAEAIACLLAIVLSEPTSKSQIDKNIDTATGYSLDIIGNNNFCRRQLRNDTDYRTAIKLTLNTKNPKTTADDIMRAFKQFYKCNQCFCSEEKYNIFSLYVSFSTTPTNLDFSLMKNVIAAGVHLNIYYAVGNEIISIVETDPARYGIKISGNGKNIIGNNSFLCASKFTKINIS